MIHGNIVRRLRWLFWKWLAVLTSPWRPKDKIGNPRDKKRKKESELVLFLTVYLRVINAAMGAVIIVALLLLCWVKAGG
jgi:hypothetical protein